MSLSTSQLGHRSHSNLQGCAAPYDAEVKFSDATYELYSLHHSLLVFIVLITSHSIMSLPHSSVLSLHQDLDCLSSGEKGNHQYFTQRPADYCSQSSNMSGKLLRNSYWYVWWQISLDHNHDCICLCQYSYVFSRFHNTIIVTSCIWGPLSPLPCMI